MLTIKKRLAPSAFFFVSGCLVLQLAACTPSGPRALLKGERLLSEGKYVEAAEKLEIAVKELPQNAQAWNHLGMAYHHAGSFKKASQSYQQALQRDRNLATARFNLGSLELEQRNYPAAIDSLTTYVSLQSQSIDGWLKLAAAQLRLALQSSAADKSRHLEGARRSFENVLRLGSVAEAHNGLGIIHVQRNKPREALASFGAALQAQSGYAPALLNIAILHHYHLNDRRMALQEYNDYLSLNPRPENWKEVQGIAHSLDLELNPPPRVAVTTNATPPAPSTGATPTNNFLVRVPPTNPPPPDPSPVRVAPVTKAPVKAVTTVVKTNTIPPPVYEPVVEVARVANEPELRVARDVPRPKDVPVALATNLSSGLTEPEPRIARNATKPGLLQKMNPVTWFSRKNKSQAAAPVAVPDLGPATNLIAANPAPITPLAPKAPILHYHYKSPPKKSAGNRRTAEPLFSQGIQFQREGHFAEAIDSYRRAAQADPAFFEAFYNLGLASYDAGDLDGSLLAYENALALKPDSKNARYNFGLALQKANFPQEAVKELERVLTEHPEETRAHLSLANLYAQQLFQAQLARNHYLKVLESEPKHPQATAIRYWLAANP